MEPFQRRLAQFVSDDFSPLLRSYYFPSSLTAFKGPHSPRMHRVPGTISVFGHFAILYES